MSQKLIKKHTSDNPEDQYILPFLSQIQNSDSIVEYEAIKTTNKGKTPDYIVNGDIYIEVKALHDASDVQRSAQWGKITNKLQELLSAKFTEESMKGLYCVNAPWNYKLIGDKKFNKVVNDIIDGIKNNHKVVTSCGISFGIEKVNDKDNEAYLSSFSGVSSINPAGTIYQNIASKIGKANKQLSHMHEKYKPRKRIVLLVNKYRYADRISEVIEGLSLCYNDLLNYDNIDEIWFQQETRAGNCIHTKIYSSKFINEFENCEISPDNKENQEQFQLWYWALDKIKDKKPQIWDALRRFLEKHTPEEIFDDSFKRQEMTRLGLWLLEQNMIEEAIWLVAKFINDPDPVEPPSDYSGDPTFDYDAKIRNGDDPMIITSVMGHLAWTVQSLARKSSPEDCDGLVKAFEFTKTVLIKRANLYTIQQWLIPLIEIANRRLGLLNEDKEQYKAFRSLLIGTSGNRNDSLVAKYGKYSSIAKNLTHVFSSFKDLSTEEAKFVLDNLDIDEDIGVLLIYFAIYRKNHYKKGDEFGDKFGDISPDIWEYDSRYAETKLRGLICKNEEGRQIQNIAWNFWKLTKDNPSQFEVLKVWYDLLFDQSMNFTLFSYLESILEDNIATHPDDCKKWIKQLLNVSLKYIDENGIMKFMQRKIITIPKALAWLETNDSKYYKSIIAEISKLEKDGVLSRHDCINSND
jgi:hypothetical protein